MIVLNACNSSLTHVAALASQDILQALLVVPPKSWVCCAEISLCCVFF